MPGHRAPASACKHSELIGIRNISEKNRSKIDRLFFPVHKTPPKCVRLAAGGRGRDFSKRLPVQGREATAQKSLCPARHLQFKRRKFGVGFLEVAPGVQTLFQSVVEKVHLQHIVKHGHGSAIHRLLQKVHIIRYFGQRLFV